MWILETLLMATGLVKSRLRLAGNERGATAVEYGLMVALIAVVILVAVAAIGTNLSATFECVAQSISSFANAC